MLQQPGNEFTALAPIARQPSRNEHNIPDPVIVRDYNYRQEAIPVNNNRQVVQGLRQIVTQNNEQASSSNVVVVNDNE